MFQEGTVMEPYESISNAPAKSSSTANYCILAVAVFLIFLSEYLEIDS